MCKTGRMMLSSFVSVGCQILVMGACWCQHEAVDDRVASAVACRHCDSVSAEEELPPSPVLESCASHERHLHQ